jgi:hypothetical protein
MSGLHKYFLLHIGHLLYTGLLFIFTSFHSITSTFSPWLLSHTLIPSPNTSADTVYTPSFSSRIFAVGRRSRTASMLPPLYLNLIFLSLPPYMNCTLFRNSPSSNLSLYGILKCSSSTL